MSRGGDNLIRVGDKVPHGGDNLVRDGDNPPTAMITLYSPVKVVTIRTPIPLSRLSIGQAKYFLDQGGFFLLFLILI